MKPKYVMVAYKWKGDILMGKAYCFTTEKEFSYGDYLVVGDKDAPTIVQAVCMTDDPEQTKLATKPIIGLVSWL